MGDRLDPERWEELMKALAHPLRPRILIALFERPGVTIRQISERLGEPVRRVRHQVGGLLGQGLVEVTGKGTRRGVIEHRYATRVPVAFEDDDWSDKETRVHYSQEVVRMLLADIGVAARAGTFGTDPDHFEARSYGEVDDACFEVLAELHARFCREIDDAVTAGRERIRKSGEPGTEIVSAVFFFEAPLWGGHPRAGS